MGSSRWKKKALQVMLVLGVMWPLAGGLVCAQALNRVALVVQYGDGSLSTHCVEFAEPQITGLDVLLRSGLEVIYLGGGLGTAICKIGPQGCDDPGNCFCACKGTGCMYWSYWHWKDGAWQYSSAGASSYVVEPGSVEGWTWGKGTASGAPRPPDVRFEDICHADLSQTNRSPAPLPTSTAMPTHAVRPADVPGPLPTRTPVPPMPTAVTLSTREVVLLAPTAVPLPTQTSRPDPTATFQPISSPTAALSKGAVSATIPPDTPVPAVRPFQSNYVFFAALVVVLLLIGLTIWYGRRSLPG